MSEAVHYAFYLALAAAVGLAHRGRRDQHPEAYETCPLAAPWAACWGGLDRVSATG